MSIQQAHSKQPGIAARFMRRINPIVVAILRSPLHGLLSNRLVLLTIRGRKSGELYTFPVEYKQDLGHIVIITHAERVWWRNLEGGADLTVHLRGEDIHAVGTAVPYEEQVLLAVAQLYPALSPEHAAEFAKGKVLVELQLKALPHTTVHAA
ncbi:MAG: hypothetical protein IPM16_20350 [Chloroflexi bacterium]|nr:hypothetical protein [Chloroflexota bacterium]